MKAAEGRAGRNKLVAFVDVTAGSMMIAAFGSRQRGYCV